MAKKAPRTRRPRVARRRVIRRAGRNLAKSEFASMKQTISLVNDQMNVVYRLDNITLSDFDRAVQVARAYQYYKISKVELLFKPFADTFTNSTSQSVPYLHYLIIKGDNMDAGTFNQLRDAGAKPIRFDDKTIVRSWKPAVLQANVGEDQNIPGPPPYTNFAIARTSPWLATNYNPGEQSLAWQPSKVPHKGILYGVQQDYSVLTQYYDVTITAHFQFKKPQTLDTNTPVASTQKSLMEKGEVPSA